MVIVIFPLIPPRGGSVIIKCLQKFDQKMQSPNETKISKTCKVAVVGAVDAQAGLVYALSNWP